MVHYFHSFGPSLCPTKADTPLVVDADAVLTFSVALESFQLVAWR